MPYAIAFDVYGTLVNPLELNQHLQPLVGEFADRFAELWREKQIEYTFRRGLMQQYENFSVCTQQAMQYTMQTLKVTLSETEQEGLLAEYQNLNAFPEAIDGLQALKANGHQLVAFSNGIAAKVRDLLGRSGVLPQLEAVISVDDLKTFKPNPAVYDYLVKRVGKPAGETWLVSGNPWDAIGAKSAGLKAAWVKRNPDQVFDPWGIEPDIVVKDLLDLAQQIGS
jgi:2-haloacid dehalogenase